MGDGGEVVRASLTEAAVCFTHIELVAQGAADDVDEVGGEAGKGGADGELFGGASESGGVGNVGAADTAALPTWIFFNSSMETHNGSS
jgi:hypothetical protein